MSDTPTNSVNLLQTRWQAELAERAALGRQRQLHVAAPVRVNLADNDYLGLADDESVKNAVRTALADGPVSASSSPLVRGYQAAHAKLEKQLGEWHGFPSGLVWNSGFAANQSIMGTLAAPGDLIFADRFVHHSLIAGILKSGAKFTRFHHNDLDALAVLLEKSRSPGRAIWVITESVYSMDGDSPDLARLAELKRRFGFIWLLDEAHALGWYGPQGQGLAAAAGVANDVDILIGTFGKALGGMGAYSLLREPSLREALINHAGEFIYSTYLSPLLATAATAAIARVCELSLQAEKWRKQSHQFRKNLRKHGWNAPNGDSPIVPIVIGEDIKVVALGDYLQKNGFAVGVIRPPTVAEGSARLRLSLKATTRAEDLAALIDTMNAWRKAEGAK